MWHLATIATRWVILRRRGSRATYRPVAQRVILPSSVPLSYPIQFTPGNHGLYCFHATFRLTLCTNQRWAMAPREVVTLSGLTHWLTAQRAAHREEKHREPPLCQELGRAFQYWLWRLWWVQRSSTEHWYSTAGCSHSHSHASLLSGANCVLLTVTLVLLSYSLFTLSF